MSQEDYRHARWTKISSLKNRAEWTSTDSVFFRFSQRLRARPGPTFGKPGKARRSSHLHRLTGTSLTPGSFAIFDAYAVEKLITRFILTPLCPGNLRLRRHETSFAAGLKYGCAILLEFRLHTLERSHSGVEPRELLLDLGDDAALFG